MKNYIFPAFLLMICLSPTARSESAPKFVVEAREVVAQFQFELKSALVSSMKSGGPQQGVNVCKERAPEIAKDVSQKSGWRVRRTSLKTRNPLNAPSSQEKEILQQFAEQAKAEKPIGKLEWWQESPEERVYIKAIPMGSVCQICHGENIDPRLKETIVENYPADKATGFSVGEIRGAFVLDQTLEKSEP